MILGPSKNYLMLPYYPQSRLKFWWLSLIFKPVSIILSPARAGSAGTRTGPLLAHAVRGHMVNDAKPIPGSLDLIVRLPGLPVGIMASRDAIIPTGSPTWVYGTGRVEYSNENLGLEADAKPTRGFELACPAV